MDKITVHCSKCGAVCADGLGYCEFCGEKNATRDTAVPPASPLSSVPCSPSPEPCEISRKKDDAPGFDFVRATQRTLLVMLAGVFLFLCPVQVHPFYKLLAVLSALSGLWVPVLFRALGITAMALVLWMSVTVYELGRGARQLFTEKDYYSQGVKGPIPEWALFKKTLFQSLSGFEWVCLFAAAAGAAYIFWIGFYAARIRTVKRGEAEK